MYSLNNEICYLYLLSLKWTCQKYVTNKWLLLHGNQGWGKGLLYCELLARDLTIRLQESIQGFGSSLYQVYSWSLDIEFNSP